MFKKKTCYLNYIIIYFSLSSFYSSIMIGKNLKFLYDFNLLNIYIYIYIYIYKIFFNSFKCLNVVKCLNTLFNLN